MNNGYIDIELEIDGKVIASDCVSPSFVEATLMQYSSYGRSQKRAWAIYIRKKARMINCIIKKMKNET